MILRSRRCLSPPQKPFSVTEKREKMRGGWWWWCWCVCVCVFGGGDGGLAEWPFPLSCWLSCFCFAAFRHSYNKFDFLRPFLYPEILNTTQHTHFIR